MSIQATSRATAPPPTPTQPAVATNASTATPSAEVQDPPAPHLDRIQLHHPEKVDLGFRAEEMRANLKEAVDRLNAQMQSHGRDLSFRLDEKIDRTIITVKNLQTGEVVRQIPSEEVVRLAHSIEDMKGLLFNKIL